MAPSILGNIVAEKTTKMINAQRNILDLFLLEFLPAQNSKRKYKGNELSKIHNTLYRLFKKHFGFELTLKELQQALSRLGYENYEAYSTFNFEEKSDRLVKEPRDSNFTTFVRTKYGRESYENYQVYNVSASRVRDIFKSLSKLPPNTGFEKRKKIETLAKEIQAFKTRMMDKEDN